MWPWRDECGAQPVAFEGGLGDGPWAPNGHAIERGRAAVLGGNGEQVVDLGLAGDQQRVDLRAGPARRAGRRIGAGSTGRSQTYGASSSTRAPRAGSDWLSSGLGSPYSWTATVLPRRSIDSSDVQHFGAWCSAAAR